MRTPRVAVPRASLRMDTSTNTVPSTSAGTSTSTADQPPTLPPNLHPARLLGVDLPLLLPGAEFRRACPTQSTVLELSPAGIAAAAFVPTREPNLRRPP